MFNFNKKKKNFCFHLYYDGDNSCLFVDGREVFKFKVDNFPTQFCLGTISNGFGATKFRKKSLRRNVYDFSVDYNTNC